MTYKSWWLERLDAKFTGGRSKLMHHFYKDGAIYYLVMFSALLSSAIGGFARTDSSLAYVASMYYIGAKSMACSRIILGLRAYFIAGNRYIDGRQPGELPSAFFGTPIDSSATQVSTTIRFAVPEDVSEEDWTHAASPRLRPVLEETPGAGSSRRSSGSRKDGEELELGIIRSIVLEEGEETPISAMEGGDDGGQLSPVLRWMQAYDFDARLSMNSFKEPEPP